MATYTDSGSGKNLFTSQAGGSLDTRFLLVRADLFGLLNPDGSKSYYHGSGLVWNQANGMFTAGTITQIHHLDEDGNRIDSITGLSLPVSILEPLLEAQVSKSAVRALQAELLSGDDTLQGSRQNDRLLGLAGGDTIRGEAGKDHLDGGKGIDFLVGGKDRDVIYGGKGGDTIDGGRGVDLIAGGPGDDVIYGGRQIDVIIYDFAWKKLHAEYDPSDFSVWVAAPDGRDHLFAALQIATTTGTWFYDVPTADWVKVSNLTSDEWLAGL